MKLDNLLNYIEARKNEGLDKIDASIAVDPEGIVDGFYVLKTKETYVFADEDEADAKINEIRQYPGFEGCSKKFKQGKVSKNGEIVRPDAWIVVIKLLQN